MRPTSLRLGGVPAADRPGCFNSRRWRHSALLKAVTLCDGGPAHRKIVGLLVDAVDANIPGKGGLSPLDHAQAMDFAEIAGRIAASLQK